MSAAPDPLPEYVYNLCRASDWEAALAKGAYEGSADDKRDGFIHFSTAAQVAESAARHRAGQSDILLLTVRVKSLGPALAWEPSRGGELFPHLYGPLPVEAVERVEDLPLTAEGKHVFPAHVRPHCAPQAPAGEAPGGSPEDG